MKLDKKTIIGVSGGLLMVIASAIFLRENKNLLWFILVISVLVMILPFVISVIFKSGKQKEKEARFLEFVRDLVENVKSGTPISKGIINLRTRDYGQLTEHVEKLANQISLGIPLSKALFNFGNDTKSKVVIRAVSLISEAEKAGGDIGGILESVAHSVNQTEELKKERKASVYNLVVQGYIIFIVFIVIMLVLQFKILPLTSELGSVEGISLSVRSSSAEDFSTPMFALLLVQAFFAGLVIGKVSEGSLVDGIKHSFILLSLALLVVTGANVFFG